MNELRATINIVWRVFDEGQEVGGGPVRIPREDGTVDDSGSSEEASYMHRLQV